MLSINLELKSQRKMKGVFREAVGYTIAEFDYDSVNKCNRLVDIIYIDSINIKKQLSVVFGAGSFTALKTLRKKDLRKIILLDSSNRFNFFRGYKIEFNPSNYFERILVGKVFSNGTGSKFVLSKAKCSFYEVLKATDEWRMPVRNHVICSEKRRKALNPIYIINNVEYRSISVNEIERLSLTMLPQKELSYENCH